MKLRLCSMMQQLLDDLYTAVLCCKEYCSPPCPLHWSTRIQIRHIANKLRSLIAKAKFSYLVYIVDISTTAQQSVNFTFVTFIC